MHKAVISSKNSYCQSCGKPRYTHFFTWIRGLFISILPTFETPYFLDGFVSLLAEKILIACRLARYEKNFGEDDVIPRMWCFVKEMQSRGTTFSLLKVLGISTNYLQMNLHGTIFHFEIYPDAAFANGKNALLVENKYSTKNFLAKNGFPVPEGNAFYTWQKARALEYGEKLGYPIVVKPLGGSVSQHITTNICDRKSLEIAIAFSCAYSPCFIIEKYFSNTAMYRATIIDFENVFIVKELPANVLGDGVHTIEELVTIKNSGVRSLRGGGDRLLFPVVVNETTEKLLQDNNLTMKSILTLDERIFLQRDPFPKLGYDLVEMTTETHPDNIALFKDIAKAFTIHVVGLDVLFPDIKVSWKEGGATILEANSSPCIEVHHTPTIGTPTNPAGAIAKLFNKYYI